MAGSPRHVVHTVIGVEGDLERRLQAASVRLPRQLPPAGAELEQVLADRWAQKNARRGFSRPPPHPPVARSAITGPSTSVAASTANAIAGRGKAVSGQAAPRHSSGTTARPPLSVGSSTPNAPQQQQRKQAIDLDAARVIERSKFRHRVHLRQLGVHLVVDDELADYAPDRSEREPRSQVAAQREARAELASFLFDKDHATSNSALQLAMQDTTDDADLQPGQHNRSTTTVVAEAARVTLQAIASLPPGALECTPYLAHMAQRCRVDTVHAADDDDSNSADTSIIANGEATPSHPATVVVDARAEEDLFAAFSNHLATLTERHGRPLDGATVESEFRSFATAYCQKRLLPATEAEQQPAAGEQPAVPQAADQEPHAPPHTARARLGSTRPPTAAARPWSSTTNRRRPESAKFMYSVSQKRAFLTELASRSSDVGGTELHDERNPQDDASQRAVEHHVRSSSPRPNNAAANAGTSPNSYTHTTVNNLTGASVVVQARIGAASVHDLQGPRLEPCSATAARSVVERRHQHQQRHGGEEGGPAAAAAETLDEVARHHEHAKAVGSARFRVRSAKATQKLAQRGICRPNSATSTANNNGLSALPPGIAMGGFPAGHGGSDAAE